MRSRHRIFAHRQTPYEPVSRMKRNRNAATRLFFFLAISVLLPAFVAAQKTTISLKVQDDKFRPVPYATVVLIPASDSTAAYSQVTDSLGRLRAEAALNQPYRVKVTAVNFLPFEKTILILPGRREFSFTLQPGEKTLSAVVVKSNRPLMRQEDDKTIVDPENLAASSTNGYEILEKTPGLFVDQDGNVYIASTTPATILINGRETKMSTADLATLLKSLPPNAIQSIEIVRTPSAKYDASGSGGVVNIILRKGVKPGMNGSFNAGMQQGIYGNQFAGITLNNNDGRRSSSLNLNYARRNSYELIVTNRLFAPDSLLSQRAETVYPSDTYSAGYSLQLPADSSWELDLSGFGSITRFDNGTVNGSRIDKVSSSQLISDNRTDVGNLGSNGNLRLAVNARKKIDTTGGEWTHDLFYTYSRSRTEQDYQTGFTYPVNLALGGDGTNLNNRHLVTFSSDLRKKWGPRFTFESGIKSSLLWFYSDAQYRKGQNGSLQTDPGRTNRFRYFENINAGYLQGSQTFGRNMVLKFGTRLENTRMDGNQEIPSDTNFHVHRTDLFPYAYLSKKVISIAGFELRAYLVYRRTIARPVYEQLNPFSRYVDQYLSEQGNPALRPQFNNNYEANISVNETPLLAIGINQTRDIFTNVIYQSDSSRSQAYRTYDNLGSNREFYLRGLGAIPPGHRYFFVVGSQYNHNFYQGFYEGKPLSFRKGSWSFFTYHTFRIDGYSQITLNGFIRLRGQLQFYELSNFGAMNASINRQFLKRKLIVTLSANDIFRTLRYDFIINQGTVSAQGYRLNDTRRFGINLRYNFGIRKKEENNNLFNVESPEKTN